MNKIRFAAMVFIMVLAIAIAALAQMRDPFDIIDKNIAAMGGWEKIESQRTSHSKGTLVIEGGRAGGNNRNMESAT